MSKHTARFLMQNEPPKTLLDLPSDLLPLILSEVVNSSPPTILLLLRHVCRTFRDYLYEYMSDNILPSFFIAEHAQHSTLAVVQWAHCHGAPFQSIACINAVKGRKLDILHWLLRAGCTSNSLMLPAAARTGDLSVWRAIRDLLPIPQSSGEQGRLILSIAAGGSLDILNDAAAIVPKKIMLALTLQEAICAGNIDLAEVILSRYKIPVSQELLNSVFELADPESILLLDKYSDAVRKSLPELISRLYDHRICKLVIEHFGYKWNDIPENLQVRLCAWDDELLRWAIEKRFNIPYGIYDELLFARKYSTLRWALENKIAGTWTPTEPIEFYPFLCDEADVEWWQHHYSTVVPHDAAYLALQYQCDVDWVAKYFPQNIDLDEAINIACAALRTESFETFEFVFKKLVALFSPHYILRVVALLKFMELNNGEYIIKVLELLSQHNLLLDSVITVAACTAARKHLIGVLNWILQHDSRAQLLNDIALEACAAGHLDILKPLVALGAQLCEDHLQQAVNNGHATMAAHIISKGVDPTNIKIRRNEIGFERILFQTEHKT